MENIHSCHKIQHVEELLGCAFGHLGKVVVGVVGLGEAAEEDGHDAGQLEHLGQQERGVGHQHEERGLEEGVLSDLRELRQEGGHAPHHGPHEEGGAEDPEEVNHGLQHLHDAVRTVVVGVTQRNVLFVILKH